MAAAGAPLRAIQEWMGHRDHTTTLIYADYAPDPSQGAAWAARAFGEPQTAESSRRRPPHRPTRRVALPRRRGASAVRSSAAEPTQHMEAADHNNEVTAREPRCPTTVAGPCGSTRPQDAPDPADLAGVRRWVRVAPGDRPRSTCSAARAD